MHLRVFDQGITHSAARWCDGGEPSRGGVPRLTGEVARPRPPLAARPSCLSLLLGEQSLHRTLKSDWHPRRLLSLVRRALGATQQARDAFDQSHAVALPFSALPSSTAAAAD